MAIDHFPLILLFPLLGVLVNAVLGKRLSLRASGGLASLMVFLSFAVAVQGFLALRRGHRRGLAAGLHALGVDRQWRSARGLQPAARPPEQPDGPGRHRRRLPDPRLQHRLHGPRPRLPALLRLPEPVHPGHAAARARRQLPRPLRGLGGRGPVLLPAHRLLVRAHVHGDDVDGPGRQEGLHRQSHRRLRLPARAVPDLHALPQPATSRPSSRPPCTTRPARR